MSNIKPVVDQQTVARVLEDFLGKAAIDVRPVSSGQISATFECAVENEVFIVQFSYPNMAMGAAKERLFRDRLVRAGVPMREVVAEGTSNELRYTIAKKAPGRRLTSLEPAVFREALPSVFSTLLRIGTVEMTGTSGYGWFDERGCGPDETWKAHLSRVREEEPGLFYGNWHGMFTSTFLERDRFDAYFARMTELLSKISVPRSLVHGAFGYDNVLVEDGVVTVVLDWSDARFGDPLFDVAYMSFWPSGYDLPSMYETYCASLGVVYEQYSERLLACRYHIAMDSMRFFAKIGNRDAYLAAVKIMEGVSN